MASLIAKTAGDGLLPKTIAGLTMSEVTGSKMTAIAAYPGKIAALKAVLEEAGFGWPTPDRASVTAKGKILWSGRDQAFLIAASAPAGLSELAALTDISDGWVALSLQGKEVEAALARLVALDLSLACFPVGATARTGLQHMSMLLHRAEGDCFHLYVFRSMTAFAVHEIEVVMKALAARAAL